MLKCFNIDDCIKILRKIKQVSRLKILELCGI